jgi:hypothetical protein
LSGSQFSGILARFNADGTPDMAFGSNGNVAVPIWAQKIKIAISGNIIIGGQYGGSYDYLPAVMQLNIDGTVDSSSAYMALQQLI